MASKNVTLNLSGRLSFEHIFDPSAGPNGGAEKFSAALILEGKNNPQLPKIRKAIKDVAEAQWGSRAKAVLNDLQADDRIFLRDGDKSKRPEYQGHWYFNASNAKRPLVVDVDKTSLTKADGKPYSGCYVNMLIEVWAMQNGFGKRICASLKGVQFVRDGDAFTGGYQATVDDFEDVSNTGYAEEGFDAEEESLF
jgi:hypothetical protein